MSIIKFSFYLHNDNNFYFGNHQINEKHPNDSYSLTYQTLTHDILEHSLKERNQEHITFINEIKAIGGAMCVRGLESSIVLKTDVIELLYQMSHENINQIINQKFIKNFDKHIERDASYHGYLYTPEEIEEYLKEYTDYYTYGSPACNQLWPRYKKQITKNINRLIYLGYTKRYEFFSRHNTCGYTAHNNIINFFKINPLEKFSNYIGQRSHFHYDMEKQSIYFTRNTWQKLPR